jgi:hypothetical protein
MPKQRKPKTRERGADPAAPETVERERPSPRGYGAEDAEGQIITWAGAVYQWRGGEYVLIAGEPADLDGIARAIANP